MKYTFIKPKNATQLHWFLVTIDFLYNFLRKSLNVQCAENSVHEKFIGWSRHSITAPSLKCMLHTAVENVSWSSHELITNTIFNALNVQTFSQEIVKKISRDQEPVKLGRILCFDESPLYLSRSFCLLSWWFEVTLICS